MKMPRVRFTVRGIMVAIAGVAIVIVARPDPLDSDDRRFDFVCRPLQIQGKVAGVGRQGEWVELTIGSDDGLVLGYVMFVSRADPQSRPLGLGFGRHAADARP